MSEFKKKLQEIINFLLFQKILVILRNCSQIMKNHNLEKHVRKYNHVHDFEKKYCVFKTYSLIWKKMSMNFFRKYSKNYMSFAKFKIQPPI